MLKRLKGLFFDASPINEQELRNSRIWFIIESNLGGSVLNIVGGVYLASLCSYLGASEATNGIIISVISIMGLFQLLSPIVAEKYKRRKLIVVSGVAINRLLLGLIFLVPWLFPNHTIALILVAILFCLGYMSHHFLLPMFSIWITDVVPSEIRGKYLGLKDGISAFVSAVLFYIVGIILDTYKNAGNQVDGFKMVGFLILFLGICNTLAFLPIREPVKSRKPFKINILDVFTVPLKDRTFRPIMFITIFWYISFFLACSFFSIYQVSRLELTYSFMSTITVVNILLRIFFTPIWGRIAGKISWFTSFRFSAIFLGVGHFLWVFLTKDNVHWLFWVLTLITSIGWGGINLSLFGLQFEFAPTKGKSMYIACNNALAGILGFLTSLVGAYFIDATKGFEITINNFAISNMQMLFVISGTLTLLCTVYASFVQKKLKPIS